MEKLLPKLYKNYGDYVNRSKMLPNCIDGTIPVWKRILLGAHTIARKEFKKSAQVFGYVIGHWHPHTEAIQGTAEILVHNGFLDGKGNWGTRIGVEPIGCAAPRYTGLKINDEIEELVFKYIKDVKWEEDELEPEPVYLPTMIPLCLMARQEFNMIGFGFKTEIPTYDRKDLVKRLLYLMGERRKITISPNIEGCDILSDQKILEGLLANPEKNTIEICGKYEIDKIHHRVYIKGWSPRSTFAAIFKGINNYKNWNLIDNGDVTFLDESNDKEGTKVRLEVSRQRKKSDVFDKLVEAVESKLKTSLSYNIYVVNLLGEVKQYSVDDYLKSAYAHYERTVKEHYQRIQKEKELILDEYMLIEKIKPHLSTALKKGNLDSIIKQLSKLSNVSEEQVSTLVDKYKIKKLMTVNTDIDAIKKELKEIKNVLSDVRKKAIDDYKKLL